VRDRHEERHLAGGERGRAAREVPLTHFLAAGPTAPGKPGGINGLKNAMEFVKKAGGAPIARN